MDKELKQRIDTLLSQFPSHYVNNKAAADELFAVAIEFGLRINRGCKDCIIRCYSSLLRIKNNNYNMAQGETYLFNDKLANGYRFPNDGKVYTNANSTAEERKVIYESNESRKALFDVTTIPQKQEVKKTRKKTIKKETE